MKTTTIGQAAKQLEIHIETIRFYERKGLIEQPQKPESGYRHYSTDIINRIRFIKRAQELGFTLKEIVNLLSLNDQPCTQVQDLAEQKLASVQEKVKDLQRLEFALKEMIVQCMNNPDDDHCPIIEALQP
ncbi:MAG TPA: Hg(II)-responsive transcriptional regulator [Aeromonadales bacterium]|nr:Hg(II)-responsive transcriptional regulator [Aeromonadales bacterium]